MKLRSRSIEPVETSPVGKGKEAPKTPLRPVRFKEPHQTPKERNVTVMYKHRDGTFYIVDIVKNKMRHALHLDSTLTQKDVMPVEMLDAVRDHLKTTTKIDNYDPTYKVVRMPIRDLLHKISACYVRRPSIPDAKCATPGQVFAESRRRFRGIRKMVDEPSDSLTRHAFGITRRFLKCTPVPNALSDSMKNVKSSVKTTQTVLEARRHQGPPPFFLVMTLLRHIPGARNINTRTLEAQDLLRYHRKYEWAEQHEASKGEMNDWIDQAAILLKSLTPGMLIDYSRELNHRIALGKQEDDDPVTRVASLANEEKEIILKTWIKAAKLVMSQTKRVKPKTGTSGHYNKLGLIKMKDSMRKQLHKGFPTPPGPSQKKRPPLSVPILYATEPEENPVE